MSKTTTMRGMDCIVYINAVPFAVCDEFSWSADYGAKTQMQLDSLTPAEIHSTRALISANIHYIRQHDSAGAEGVGAAPTLDTLSRERYVYLQVVDRRSDTVYLEIPKALMGTQSGSARAKSIVEGTMSFTGLGFSNEN